MKNGLSPTMTARSPVCMTVWASMKALTSSITLQTRLRKWAFRNGNVFEAAVELGEYTGSVQDLINLTENLDCYNLYSDIHSDSDLGYYWAEESGAYDTRAMGALSNYIGL